MEISEHELARIVAEADDQHRAAMATIHDDLAAHHVPSGIDGGSSRRHFLRRAAFGGLAITVGSAVIPVAGLVEAAAAADPPDPTLLAFAESIELALASAYTTAMASAPVTTAAKTMFTTFAGHHQQHAAAVASLGAQVGAKLTHQPNPKFLAVANGQFNAARDQNHVFAVGQLLESAAESTYLSALGTMTALNAQKLAASILPVESQHAVAFAAGRGQTVAEAVPAFVTTNNALDPTKYTLS